MKLFLGGSIVVLAAIGLFSSAAYAQWTYSPELAERISATYGDPQDYPALNHQIPAKRLKAPPSSRGTRELPSYFNWHDRDGVDWMSPVRNQASCGSCWTFGTIGAMEGAINIGVENPDRNLDLSEQFMVSCGAGSCENGGAAEEVLGWLRTKGIPDEACYPYTATEGECSAACADWEARAVKIYDWGIMLSPYPDEVKAELLNGPMAVTMRVDPGFNGYTDGVFEGDSTPCDFFNNTVNHVVTLVGWEDATDSWIARNSWDDDWGMGGYFKIKRGTSCLTTFSVNWLRVDLTTVPGFTREVALCSDASAPIVSDVTVGQSPDEPIRVTLSNCGETLVPWTVEEDYLANINWLDISPYKGELPIYGDGTQEIEITLKTADKPLGDHAISLQFLPKTQEGSGVTIDLSIHITEASADGDLDQESEASADGDEELVDGDETPVDGDEPPVDGDEPVVDGDEPQEDGDEPQVDGDDPPVDGDDPQVDGDEPQVDGDEPQVDGDGPLVDGDGEPAPAAGGGSGGGCAQGGPGAGFALLLLVLFMGWMRKRNTIFHLGDRT